MSFKARGETRFYFNIYLLYVYYPFDHRDGLVSSVWIIIIIIIIITIDCQKHVVEEGYTLLKQLNQVKIPYWTFLP